MSINVSSNFLLSAQLALDARTYAVNIAARDAIPTIQRYEGLWCYVVDSDGSGNPATYQLQNGIGNGDWVLIGAGSGITGGGNPESVAFWTSATALGANIFFTRTNVTGGQVYNNAGFTSDIYVDVERYIDIVNGSDTNTGTSAGSGNAWQNPEYAIERCLQMGPGRYIIHCAAGTYPNVTLDIPDTISRGLDSANVLSIIQFEGDQSTPGNVIFQNTTGVMIYAASTTTTLRLHGITFQGNVLNNGVAISQRSGRIIFRNCVFNNYFSGHVSDGFCEAYVEAPTVFTNTYYAFSGSGTFVNAAENVIHTPPDPLTQTPYTFNVTNGRLVFGFGKTYSITCPVGAHKGALIRTKDTFIGFGQLNTFVSNDGECLYDIDSGANTEGAGNSFFANDALSYCKITNTAIYNNPTCAWWATAFAPEGVKLYGQAIFSSDAILNLGAPPFGFLQDYMTTYVQYQANPTYTTFGLDNRYRENYGFTCPGVIPQSYSLANLSPDGLGSDPYYIFVAPYNCQIVEFAVGTRVANGAAHTDTYIVGVNGASSAMSVAITNGDGGSATSPVVNLVTGDVVSIRLTTDAGTVAEDPTVQITVRRYG